MNPALLILLALLGIPILEIAVFILIGGEIGVVATLAMIFVTAVMGTALLRYQGFSLLSRIRAETDAGRIPGEELGHGAMILLAGILLLTPGFVTDAMGFLLFVPAVRKAIWLFAVSRMDIHVVETGGRRPHRPDNVVDLDEDEWSRKPDPETPWGQGRLR